MSRTEHFADGASRVVDVFHGTNPKDAKSIQRTGFQSWGDGDVSHFTSTAEAARSWRPDASIIHLRVPEHELEDHGHQPAEPGLWPAHHVYGVAGGGTPLPERVHCVDGRCTK